VARRADEGQCRWSVACGGARRPAVPVSPVTCACTRATIDRRPDARVAARPGRPCRELHGQPQPRDVALAPAAAAPGRPVPPSSYATARLGITCEDPLRQERLHHRQTARVSRIPSLVSRLRGINECLPPLRTRLFGLQSARKGESSASDAHSSISGGTWSARGRRRFGRVAGQADDQARPTATSCVALRAPTSRRRVRSSSPRCWSSAWPSARPR